MIEEGLVWAYHFDGKGGVRTLSPKEAIEWHGKDGFVWLHFSRDFPDTHTWLTECADLDLLAVEALMAEETRPRITEMEKGTLLFLRSINLNPGAQPEDMVSVRVWIEEHRMISVRIRKLINLDDLRNKFTGGKAPRSVAELVALITRSVLGGLEPVIESLEEELDILESALLERPVNEIQPRLTVLRNRSMVLRRYLLPQRDVVAHLATGQVKWVTKATRPIFIEMVELVTRIIENLDTVRERAGLLHEEIKNTLSERINRNMLILALVAAIFLPLNFVTSLLGINVSGIPGADYKFAFWVVLGALLTVMAVEIIYLKRRKWL
ncbi:MAG: zinc transporter ZntB [Rickettsiales bacterium]